MHAVKMIASDLDGTLLRSDGTVSERTRAALREAEATGLLVAFVTGRPPRWLHEIAEQTGHSGVAVAANGAVTYDLDRELLLEVHTLAPDQLGYITGVLRSTFPGVHFGVEYGENFASEPEYEHDWEISPSHDPHGVPIAPPLIAGLATIIARPAVKLLAKDLEADPDEFLYEASALLAGRASVTHSSRNGLLEIGAPGITKASGLARLAASHGVLPSEVAAIGDMPNDVPMLEWAGRSFAVANAHPAAQAAADEVVDSNDDDAVARLVEKLISARRLSA